MIAENNFIDYVNIFAKLTFLRTQFFRADKVLALIADNIMPLFLLTMSYLEAVFLSTLGPNHPGKSVIRLLYVQRSQDEACVVGHHSPKGESPITAI